MLNKVNKTIGLLRKLQNTVPSPSLLTIYKSFIRPHFDYGDIIYDQVYTASFRQKVESISDCNWTRTHNHLVRKQTLKHLPKPAKLLSCVVILICAVHLTVCSYHVTHAFQSESHSRVAWMSRNYLLETGAISEVTATRLWVRVPLQSLNFRYRACFEQGVPWNSDNSRVWIHSEARTLLKKIQWKAFSIMQP